MNNWLTDCPNLLLITGHYGCGKTNFTVNLALALAKMGRAVTVIDLDIVNPYFRTADFKELFAAHDIDLITPIFANTNLDIPAVSAAVDAAFLQSTRTVLVDVGGDDAGAIALGRYATRIQHLPHRCFYLINGYRYLTRTPTQAVELLRQMEAVSKVKATDLINTSNLGSQTTLETVRSTEQFANEVSALSGLPLTVTCLPLGSTAAADELVVADYIYSIESEEPSWQT